MVDFDVVFLSWILILMLMLEESLAFVIKWLSICNLHLLIAIQPTVTLVGALHGDGRTV